MQIGMIGLGRMGSNMVRRLLQGGHQCVVYNRHAEAVETLRSEGAMGTVSLQDFIARLTKPRAVWLMVPATVVDEVLAQLVPLLEAGDIIIDGGNSYYRDDLRRAAGLQKNGVHYVDAGTSGGVAGLERSYCLMIGGEKEIVQHLDPVFATLAPGVGTVSRTPRPEQTRRHCRAGLPALRSAECRALRQDGPQRHRVRSDGGLCRGPEYPA
jgi:6-phosphogluconate dehydrogenase